MNSRLLEAINVTPTPIFIIGEVPGDILFLSDIAEELDAAKAAGTQTCQLAKPEDTSRKGSHKTAVDFNAVK